MRTLRGKRVELSIECHGDDSAAFAAWLRQQGVDARLGRENCNIVDGEAVLEGDNAAGDELAALWTEFCRN